MLKMAITPPWPSGVAEGACTPPGPYGPKLKSWCEVTHKLVACRVIVAQQRLPAAHVAEKEQDVPVCRCGQK